MEQKNETTGNYTVVKSEITKTSCTISNLTEGTIYQFRVLARNAVGLGAPSSEVKIATIFGSIGTFYAAVEDYANYTVSVNGQTLIFGTGITNVTGTSVRDTLKSIVGV